ncbi:MULTISPECIES: PPK2 family polyphosphate kinase [unclassified Exiguobacterium]|uniref:PPK2 family polyphosphate kinase n=1 Tax=unclassified Exiguobacterium TaxID=2644629 RepID=UPI0010405EF1|nr:MULTISPECIES: PPK2 family polyphosphate kinase [unclassified Exiguobacterium]TCI35626.1 polyphosphate--nucleotide phosphotransferase [Exiguobacterium sp. SH4S7]TCI43578.1 polyphosphate--nucleotide phosphotransferase [Exiguobacterium sp. SH5S32]TCI52524.1 polyphosphate--nucleotide phosphotransferase [Exiguobacterium sp. SH1S4]TCI65296.1 polyphosphate--nucleotide phosphotransferase [Exiguobacterium sp. SH0S2]TCI68833.1 polyphosphate--nucleotide phosphotransferase [Exiguobacterium sp. SH1S1]
MNIHQFRIDHKNGIRLSDFQTSMQDRPSDETLTEELIPKSVDRLKELHWKLYAEAKKGVVVVLQALDAGGKDEAISYIFSNLNAQGLKTNAFQKPSDTEKKHDYLWRMHDLMPERGQVGILNRSYYEEVIAPRVHDLLGDEVIPDEANVWAVRYRQINDYEQYLKENGFEVIKFFFNVSKEVQRDRLLERLKDPKKNWEFSFSDVEERRHWDDYQAIFEDMLSNTSTSQAPWYILPADDDWYARYIVSTVMIDVLENINPQFPTFTEEEQEKIDEAIKELESE